MKKMLNQFLCIVLTMLIIVGASIQFTYAEEPIAKHLSTEFIEANRTKILNEGIKPDIINNLATFTTNLDSETQPALCPSIIPAYYGSFYIDLFDVPSELLQSELSLEVFDSNAPEVNIAEDVEFDFWPSNQPTNIWIRVPISTSYNDGHGLINNNVYTIVVKQGENAIYTYTRTATAQPIIDGIAPYYIGENVSDHEFRISGYNLDEFSDQGLSIDLINENNETIASSGTLSIDYNLITTTMTFNDPSKVTEGCIYTIRVNNTTQPIYYYGQTEKVYVVGSTANRFNIRPGVLPAGTNYLYFYIEGDDQIDFGSSKDEIVDNLYVQIYKADDLNKTNLVDTYWRWFDANNMQIGVIVKNNGKLQKDQLYTIQIMKDGALYLEKTVVAKLGPQILYINNNNIPVGSSKFRFMMEGNALQLFKNYNGKLNLYKIEADNSQTLVGTSDQESMQMIDGNLEVIFNKLLSEQLTDGSTIVLKPVIDFPVACGVLPPDIYEGMPTFTVSDVRYSISGSIDSGILTEYLPDSVIFKEDNIKLTSTVDSTGKYMISGLTSGYHSIQVTLPGHLRESINTYVTGNMVDYDINMRSGDINADNRVGIDDLVALSLNYDKSSGFDSRTDINNDKRVDLLDLTALGTNYGQQNIKEFSMAIGWDVLELDPQKGSDSDLFNVNNAVLEGLVRVHDGKVQPGMASTWTVSPDQLTYTFSLREASWSDGVPVKAQDFVYAVKRLINPDNGFEYAYAAYDIVNAEAYNLKATGDFSTVGIRAINDMTLEIKLREKSSYFLSKLGLMSFSPTREDIVLKYEGDFAKSKDNMVYNGPFKITYWQNYDKIVLLPNHTYWDKSNIKLECVRIYLAPENRVAGYYGGKLDLVDISTDEAAYLRDSGEINYTKDGSLWYLSLNTQGSTSEIKPYLSNSDFRKAITHVLDRQYLIDNAFNGICEPARRFVLPQIAGVNNSYGEEYPLDFYSNHGDVDKASGYLESSLVSLGKTVEDIPTLKLLTTTNTTSINYCNKVASALEEKLGIKVTVSTLPFSEINEKSSQYDMVLRGWAPDYNDPMAYLEIMASWSGINITGWSSSSSSVYDNLLNQAKAANTKQERLQKLFEAENLLLQESPVIPLNFRQQTYLKKSYVDNLSRGFLGSSVDFIYVDVLK